LHINCAFSQGALLVAAAVNVIVPIAMSLLDIFSLIILFEVSVSFVVRQIGIFCMWLIHPAFSFPGCWRLSARALKRK